MVPPRPAANRRGVLHLSAKALKVTLVLDPAQLAEVTVADGSKQVEFAIAVGSRIVGGAFNAKSLRRTVAAIAEHGPENVVVVVQGALADERLASAGISAMPKGPRSA